MLPYQMDLLNALKLNTPCYGSERFTELGLFSFSLSLYHKEVPLLLKDPVSLLIQILLTLPSTMEIGKNIMDEQRGTSYLLNTAILNSYSIDMNFV